MIASRLFPWRVVRRTIAGPSWGLSRAAAGLDRCNGAGAVPPRVADQVYRGINTELVQATFIGVHTDAMNPAMYGPTLAWLRIQLMGDAQAGKTFYPATTCGLYQEPAWKYVRYKNTP